VQQRLVRRLFRQSDGNMIDLTKDNQLPWLCEKALEAKEIRLNAQRAEEGYKAEIIRKIRNADRAICSGYIIDFPEHSHPVPEKPSYTRQYRQLNIKGTL
jgi:hypothetical protein